MKITLLLNIISFTTALLAYLTIIFDIGVYYNLLFLGIYLFAILNECYLQVKFPKWLLNVVAVFSIIMFSYKINMDTVNTIILRCLILLLFIKLLTNKSSRDYLQIIALTFFLVAGAALIKLNITYIVLTFMVIILSILQLLILSFYHFDAHYYFRKRTFIAITKNFITFAILLIPLTILLFTIIPRSNYPFFDLLNKQDKALSGFVDTVKLGESNTIYLDERVAFRAKMPEIDKRHLFWRGVELNTFDGKRWTYSENYREDQSSSNSNKIIEQDIYLQPLGTKYIIALDKPIIIVNHKNNISIKNHILTTTKKVNKPIHYTVRSVLSDVIHQPKISKGKYVKMPIVNEKIVTLAKRLKGKNEADTIKGTLQYISNNGYKYTIEDLPVSEDPLYEFLFESKKGNCELYASAFAAIMRLNGIPVRLISGFYGGEYNNYLKYYTVSFKNSHVWAEVWVNNNWLRINPSPYEITIANRDNRFKGLRMLIDSIEYYWSIYVINYDLEKQLTVLEKLKGTFGKNSKILIYKALVSMLFIFILLSIIVLIIKILKDTNSKKSIKLIRLLENIARKKYGIKRSNMSIFTFINILPLSSEKKFKLKKIVLVTMEHFYKDIDITKDDFSAYSKELKILLKK